VTTDAADAPVLLVDAANVVGSRPDGWWRDRAGAAARLVGQIAARLERCEASAGRVVVVLEGLARQGAAEHVSGRLEVRHAPGSGDDTLAELAGPGTLLVTADRVLAGRARDRGAEVVGPTWLLDQLDA